MALIGMSTSKATVCLSYQVSLYNTRVSIFLTVWSGCQDTFVGKTFLHQDPYFVDLDDYETELMGSLTETRKIALGNVKKSQRAQKQQYDKNV